LAVWKRTVTSGLGAVRYNAAVVRQQDRFSMTDAEIDGDLAVNMCNVGMSPSTAGLGMRILSRRDERRHHGERFVPIAICDSLDGADHAHRALLSPTPSPSASTRPARGDRGVELSGSRAPLQRF